MYHENETKSGIKTSKQVVKFQLRISDQLKHLYNDQTKMLDKSIQIQYIKSATLYKKQLDNPLAWYKKALAWMARIKTQHEFIVCQLQSGIYCSIDFYIGGRVLFRLGNLETIIQKNSEGKRKESIAVQKDGSPYTIQFNQKQKDHIITFADLTKIAYEIAPASGYSNVDFNGSHFSRAFMSQLQKQKNRKGSIIRYKLSNENIGLILS